MYVIVKQYWYKQVLQGVTESRYILSILFLPAKETLPPLHLSRLQVIVNHILKSYLVLVCAKFKLICQKNYGSFIEFRLLVGLCVGWSVCHIIS